MTARSFSRRVASATAVLLTLAVVGVVGFAGTGSAAPLRPAPTTTVDDVPPLNVGFAALSPTQGAPGALVTISGVCGYDADDWGYFFEYFVNGQPVASDQWAQALPGVAGDPLGGFSGSFHVPPAPAGMYTVHVWCDVDLSTLTAARNWHLTFEVTPARGGSTRRG
jgi:hypothetical protein